MQLFTVCVGENMKMYLNYFELGTSQFEFITTGFECDSGSASAQETLYVVTFIEAK